MLHYKVEPRRSSENTRSFLLLGSRDLAILDRPRSGIVCGDDTGLTMEKREIHKCLYRLVADHARGPEGDWRRSGWQTRLAFFDDACAPSKRIHTLHLTVWRDGHAVMNTQNDIPWITGRCQRIHQIAF